ncbi:OprD family outer membrane porin [Robertkochia flava]|uniref:OprD family outer membrane porin n=1 Tax=Robertkochia flava TaxID=3447986 RepID=UPI001CCC642D|nr:OprD family outer membrane porin [Robertkochia marina]
MMRKYILSTLVITLFSFSLWAQKNDEVTPQKGTLSGQWRTYFMNTINKGELKDYYALATGGYVKYEYQFSSGLYLGGALYTSLNTNIQDLNLPDPITGQASRYEIGLFDIEDPDDRWIALLGEMYLGYAAAGHDLKVGRMKVKSTFLNPQDGRMIPTLVQGIWYQYGSAQGHKFQIGVLDRIAPRSTDKFFEIGESIGLYPVGRDIAGEPSLYRENVNSDFVILANSDLRISKQFSVELWDFYVDNVFNSLYIRPTYKVNPKWTLQAEWLHQNRLDNGGNAIDSLSYFRNKFADVIGGKVAYRINKTSSVSLAYDRITGAGRFLFPREWGREFLFSFQKRERSEGTAGNHALVAYFNTQTEFPALKTKVLSTWSAGQHWKDDPFNPALNKYAFPSYAHFNADLFFEFEGLKGFQPEFLVTYKVANGDFPDSPNFIMNKADMWNINLVLNYNF